MRQSAEKRVWRVLGGGLGLLLGAFAIADTKPIPSHDGPAREEATEESSTSETTACVRSLERDPRYFPGSRFHKPLQEGRAHHDLRVRQLVDLMIRKVPNEQSDTKDILDALYALSNTERTPVLEKHHRDLLRLLCDRSGAWRPYLIGCGLFQRPTGMDWEGLFRAKVMAKPPEMLLTEAKSLPLVELRASLERILEDEDIASNEVFEAQFKAKPDCDPAAGGMKQARVGDFCFIAKLVPVERNLGRADEMKRICSPQGSEKTKALTSLQVLMSVFSKETLGASHGLPLYVRQRLLVLPKETLERITKAAEVSLKGTRADRSRVVEILYGLTEERAKDKIPLDAIEGLLTRLEDYDRWFLRADSNPANWERYYDRKTQSWKEDRRSKQHLETLLQAIPTDLPGLSRRPGLFSHAPSLRSRLESMVRGNPDRALKADLTKLLSDGKAFYDLWDASPNGAIATVQLLAHLDGLSLSPSEIARAMTNLVMDRDEVGEVEFPPLLYLHYAASSDKDQAERYAALRKLAAEKGRTFSLKDQSTINRLSPPLRETWYQVMNLVATRAPNALKKLPLKSSELPKYLATLSAGEWKALLDGAEPQEHDLLLSIGYEALLAFFDKGESHLLFPTRASLSAFFGSRVQGAYGLGLFDGVSEKALAMLPPIFQRGLAASSLPTKEAFEMAHRLLRSNSRWQELDDKFPKLPRELAETIKVQLLLDPDSLPDVKSLSMESLQALAEKGLSWDRERLEKNSRWVTPTLSRHLMARNAGEFQAWLETLPPEQQKEFLSSMVKEHDGAELSQLTSDPQSQKAYLKRLVWAQELLQEYGDKKAPPLNFAAPHSAEKKLRIAQRELAAFRKFADSDPLFRKSRQIPMAYYADLDREIVRLKRSQDAITDSKERQAHAETIKTYEGIKLLAAKRLGHTYEPHLFDFKHGEPDEKGVTEAFRNAFLARAKKGDIPENVDLPGWSSIRAGLKEGKPELFFEATKALYKHAWEAFEQSGRNHTQGPYAKLMQELKNLRNTEPEIFGWLTARTLQDHWENLLRRAILPAAAPPQYHPQLYLDVQELLNQLPPEQWLHEWALWESNRAPSFASKEALISHIKGLIASSRPVPESSKQTPPEDMTHREHDSIPRMLSGLIERLTGEYLSPLMETNTVNPSPEESSKLVQRLSAVPPLVGFLHDQAEADLSRLQTLRHYLVQELWKIHHNQMPNQKNKETLDQPLLDLLRNTRGNHASRAAKERLLATGLTAAIKVIDDNLRGLKKKFFPQLFPDNGASRPDLQDSLSLELRALETIYSQKGNDKRMGIRNIRDLEQRLGTWVRRTRPLDRNRLYDPTKPRSSQEITIKTFEVHAETFAREYLYEARPTPLSPIEITTGFPLTEESRSQLLALPPVLFDIAFQLARRHPKGKDATELAETLADATPEKLLSTVMRGGKSLRSFESYRTEFGERLEELLEDRLKLMKKTAPGFLSMARHLAEIKQIQELLSATGMSPPEGWPLLYTKPGQPQPWLSTLFNNWDTFDSKYKEYLRRFATRRLAEALAVTDREAAAERPMLPGQTLDRHPEMLLASVWSLIIALAEETNDSKPHEDASAHEAYLGGAPRFDPAVRLAKLKEEEKLLQEIAKDSGWAGKALWEELTGKEAKHVLNTSQRAAFLSLSPNEHVRLAALKDRPEAFQRALDKLSPETLAREFTGEMPLASLALDFDKRNAAKWRKELTAELEKTGMLSSSSVSKLHLWAADQAGPDATFAQKTIEQLRLMESLRLRAAVNELTRVRPQLTAALIEKLRFRGCAFWIQQHAKSIGVRDFSSCEAAVADLVATLLDRIKRELHSRDEAASWKKGIPPESELMALLSESGAEQALSGLTTTLRRVFWVDRVPVMCGNESKHRSRLEEMGAATAENCSEIAEKYLKRVLGEAISISAAVGNGKHRQERAAFGNRYLESLEGKPTGEKTTSRDPRPNEYEKFDAKKDLELLKLSVEQIGIARDKKAVTAHRSVLEARAEELARLISQEQGRKSPNEDQIRELQNTRHGLIWEISQASEGLIELERQKHANLARYRDKLNELLKEEQTLVTAAKNRKLAADARQTKREALEANAFQNLLTSVGEANQNRRALGPASVPTPKWGVSAGNLHPRTLARFMAADWAGQSTAELSQEHLGRLVEFLADDIHDAALVESQLDAIAGHVGSTAARTKGIETVPRTLPRDSSTNKRLGAALDEASPGWERDPVLTKRFSAKSEQAWRDAKELDQLLADLAKVQGITFLGNEPIFDKMTVPRGDIQIARDLKGLLDRADELHAALGRPLFGGSWIRLEKKVNDLWKAQGQPPMFEFAGTAVIAGNPVNALKSGKLPSFPLSFRNLDEVRLEASTTIKYLNEQIRLYPELQKELLAETKRLFGKTANVKQHLQGIVKDLYQVTRRLNPGEVDEFFAKSHETIPWNLNLYGTITIDRLGTTSSRDGKWYEIQASRKQTERGTSSLVYTLEKPGVPQPLPANRVAYSLAAQHQYQLSPALRKTLDLASEEALYKWLNYGITGGILVGSFFIPGGPFITGAAHGVRTISLLHASGTLMQLEAFPHLGWFQDADKYPFSHKESLEGYLTSLPLFALSGGIPAYYGELGLGVGGLGTKVGPLARFAAKHPLLMNVGTMGALTPLINGPLHAVTGQFKGKDIDDILLDLALETGTNMALAASFDQLAARRVAETFKHVPWLKDSKLLKGATSLLINFGGVNTASTALQQVRTLHEIDKQIAEEERDQAKLLASERDPSRLTLLKTKRAELEGLKGFGNLWKHGAAREIFAYGFFAYNAAFHRGPHVNPYEIRDLGKPLKGDQGHVRFESFAEAGNEVLLKRIPLQVLIDISGKSGTPTSKDTSHSEAKTKGLDPNVIAESRKGLEHYAQLLGMTPERLANVLFRIEHAEKNEAGELVFGKQSFDPHTPIAVSFAKIREAGRESIWRELDKSVVSESKPSPAAPFPRSGRPKPKRPTQTKDEPQKPIPLTAKHVESEQQRRLLAELVDLVNADVRGFEEALEAYPLHEIRRLAREARLEPLARALLNGIARRYEIDANTLEAWVKFYYQVKPGETISWHKIAMDCQQAMAPTPEGSAARERLFKEQRLKRQDMDLIFPPAPPQWRWPSL